ncbi:MAG: hypothetical protein GDA56_28885 [Hormoscilla sp. GM7CHS1pb]|nr:hypothetical protein [Hormoscilla sp. GM7CHS1pb]MBC6481186.1 hypothetical protein [Hormoscilla sp. GM7CHS1pb]
MALENFVVKNVDFDPDIIEINEARRSNLNISQLLMNDLEQSQVKYNLGASEICKDSCRGEAFGQQIMI